MHRFDRNDGLDSRATFTGGRNGMVMGAVAGALLFALATLLMETLTQTSTGAISAIAGAAAGGLAGMMIGALRARRGGYPGYDGPDRRMRLVPIDTPDRRRMR